MMSKCFIVGVAILGLAMLVPASASAQLSHRKARITNNTTAARATFKPSAQSRVGLSTALQRMRTMARQLQQQRDFQISCSVANTAQATAGTLRAKPRRARAERAVKPENRRNGLPVGIGPGYAGGPGWFVNALLTAQAGPIWMAPGAPTLLGPPL
jgi:hypothetical protein